MNRKEKIHYLIDELCDQLLEYIKEKEPEYEKRWVPSTVIISELELNFPCVPLSNKQYGDKGWMFAILARILEEKQLVEFKKEVNKRSYYRTAQA